MIKGAIISSDGKYRYQLWREWDEKLPKVAIVGLNPSIADHEIDDPTIIRCIVFAKNWGYGGFYMVNLFAFRATDPRELITQSDPVGLENDNHLKDVFSRVDKVICAWGNGGMLNGRNKQVLKFITHPYCLQKNASGEPAHPLYLKKSLNPIFLFDNEIKDGEGILKEKIIEVNPFESNPSMHIFFTYRPVREKIQNQHRLKHFAPEEILELELNITDGEVIFNQSDELIIGQEIVYWYISRVGEFYLKSNEEFDATNINEEFIFRMKDIKSWKSVFIEDYCYLEMETNSREIYTSVHIPVSEFEHILRLQKELNRLSKATPLTPL